jgi:hypothetical protein
VVCYVFGVDTLTLILEKLIFEKFLLFLIVMIYHFKDMAVQCGSLRGHILNTGPF